MKITILTLIFTVNLRKTSTVFFRFENIFEVKKIVKQKEKYIEQSEAFEHK